MKRQGLQDNRNELLDYLQENEVSLEIIKKVSRELEKQDKECFKEILDEIEVAITSEKECMKRDKYSEQEVEHLNQIEMANKIKQNLFKQGESQ